MFFKRKIDDWTSRSWKCLLVFHVHKSRTRDTNHLFTRVTQSFLNTKTRALKSSLSSFIFDQNIENIENCLIMINNNPSVISIVKNINLNRKFIIYSIL